MIKLFFICLFNEFLKIKGTFALYLTILGAIFIPLIYFSYYMFKSTPQIVDEGMNPWDKFFGIHLLAAGSLLLPLFIILLSSLVIQVEHKAGGFKNIFSLPVPKGFFYLSKITVVISLIVFTYVLFFSSILCSGFLLGIFKKHLHLHVFEPNYLLYIKALFRSLMGVMGIVGIQFWLSFRMKNFVLPIGIGIVLIITGITVQRAEEAIYFPYTYHLLNLFNTDPQNFTWFTEASALGILVLLLTIIAGSIQSSKMNIT